MTDTNDVLKQLQPIFDELFGDESVPLTEETSSDDIAGWDSVAHVGLIVAVEQKFGILFDPDEIMDMEDVGELARTVSGKINAG